MDLKYIKNKYEDIKFALTMPYGYDKNWDELSNNNFIKFLDIIQVSLYILILSTPIASMLVLLFQFIVSKL